MELWATAHEDLGGRWGGARSAYEDNTISPWLVPQRCSLSVRRLATAIIPQLAAEQANKDLTKADGSAGTDALEADVEAATGTPIAASQIVHPDRGH